MPIAIANARPTTTSTLPTTPPPTVKVANMTIVPAIPASEPKWPRIYSITLIQRLAMPPAELAALWAEYREYWRGFEDTIKASPIDDALQAEYQADYLEDKEGTYR